MEKKRQIREFENLLLLSIRRKYKDYEKLIPYPTFAMKMSNILAPIARSLVSEWK